MNDIDISDKCYNDRLHVLNDKITSLESKTNDKINSIEESNKREYDNMNRLINLRFDSLEALLNEKFNRFDERCGTHRVQIDENYLSIQDLKDNEVKTLEEKVNKASGGIAVLYTLLGLVVVIAGYLKFF